MSDHKEERPGPETATGDDRSLDNIARWTRGKSGLEQTLQAGIHGVPELHKEEKDYFLGEFRERVMKVLTKKQMMETDIFPEIREALEDPRSAKIIIDGSVPDRHNDKYEKLASSLGKISTTRRDPDFKGDLGMAVVSDKAVDFSDEQITVTSWAEQMAAAGIPPKLIAASGKKVCKSCYELLSTHAPESLDRYRELSGLDRFLGARCPAHD